MGDGKSDTQQSHADYPFSLTSHLHSSSLQCIPAMHHSFVISLTIFSSNIHLISFTLYHIIRFCIRQVCRTVIWYSGAQKYRRGGSPAASAGIPIPPPGVPIIQKGNCPFCIHISVSADPAYQSGAAPFLHSVPLHSDTSHTEPSVPHWQT